MAGFMAKTGNVAPHVVNPNIAQSEQTLMDIRSDGTIPKMKIPKPMEDRTANNPNSISIHTPPGWGNCRYPNR